jgi:hypothetical protein
MSHAIGAQMDAPHPRLGEVLDFLRLIWAVDHALQTASKAMRSAIGVTGPQRLVVRIVARFPGMPAGQIGPGNDMERRRFLEIGGLAAALPLSFAARRTQP